MDEHAATGADPRAPSREAPDAQARVRELERLLDYYRTIFETVPDPLWLVEDDRYVDANVAAAMAMGFPSREAMLGSRVASVSTATQPDGHDSYARAVTLLNAARAGRVQRFEWRHRHTESGDSCVAITLSPLRFEDRQLVLGTWHDVTPHLQAEQRLEEVLRATNTGIWEFSPGSGRLVCNERWAEILGYRKQDLEALDLSTWQAWIHPHDLDDALAAIADCWSRQEALFRLELRVRHRDGHWVWTANQGKVVEWDAAGRPRRLVGTTLDVTERRQADERLKLAASVFSHASEGIMITDAAVRIVSVNDAFSRITGYPTAEVIGRSPSILRSGVHPDAFYQEMWRSLKSTGHWSGELWNRHRDGQLFAELVNISAVTDRQGRVENYVALFTDITALKQHQQQLEHSARYDALTDLPNRVLLADRLGQAMARVRRHGGAVAVAYIDLDGFKAVNDTHGHAVGDQLLVALSARMKDLLREGDTLARLGGDEFVAVIDLEQGGSHAPVIERLLRCLADPVVIDSRVLHVTASIGVTLFPDDDVDPDQLLRHADQAMYGAKQDGKNRYRLFEAHAQAHLAQRSPLALRQALERDEFRLHYQPKVNMGSGELVGVEALVRWAHPEEGLLVPVAFLPALLSQPLAGDFARWTLRESLAQVERWLAEGRRIPVSVNLCSSVLRRHGFVEALRALLADHPGIEPALLELELGEVHALEDVERIAAVIQGCGQLGVRFALDDFGSSHTSLAYLRRLPADTLKLDGHFVRAMQSGPEDLALVEAVLGMASAFRRRLVAEGVESEWQGEMLLAIGCEYGQGYNIGRPMPASDIADWADRWRPPACWRAWQGRRLRQRTLPLLLAVVEHCAWREAVLVAAEDRDARVPPLDPTACRFAAIWQDRQHHLPLDPEERLSIERQHTGVHQLGEALIAARDQAPAEWPPRRDAFCRQSDELLERLRQLVWRMSDREPEAGGP